MANKNQSVQPSQRPPESNSKKVAPRAVQIARRLMLPGRVMNIIPRVATNVALGLPFFLIGAFGTTAADLSDLSLIFLAIVLLGGAIVLIGFYGSVLTQPNPNLMPDENIQELRHPSMKPAMARIAMSVPFFLGAGYMIAFTYLPYVFPFAVFLAGLFLYLRGVIRYWINHHTIYYVTNRRVAHAYKFLWLDTTEIPVGSINAISETRNFIEMLTGRGSVMVASGISARHMVRMQEIDDPGPVAQAIRHQISERRQDSF